MDVQTAAVTQGRRRLQSDSPEGHGAPRGRLCEPGPPKISLWVETATVLQYEHEVTCGEREDFAI